MNAIKITRNRSLKLSAIFCLSLGLGFAQTETSVAQSRFGTGGHSATIEQNGNFKIKLAPETKNQASGKRQVLRPINVDTDFKDNVNGNPQVLAHPSYLRELSARQRADAARQQSPNPRSAYAWQGYPSAPVRAIPQHVGSATKRPVEPAIIRSPFADFSTRIPTIAAAHPSLKNAETSFRNGEYAQARFSVGEALQNDPNNAHLLFFATLTNLAVADYETAGKQFNAAASLLAVEQWRSVFAEADNFYGNDDFPQHIADFFEFAETSDDINVRRLRGYLAFATGKFETAQKDFEFIMNSDAKDAVLNKLLASADVMTDSESTTGDAPSTTPKLNPAKTTTMPKAN